MLYHVIRIILYCLARLLFSYQTVGGENIPRKGTALLASNHASYLDPPLVGIGTSRIVTYVAKKELFRNPTMDLFLRKVCHCIPVDRDKMDRKTLKDILTVLKKENELMLIFPEGTRTFDGKLQEPKIGAGMIAYMAKVPVIPVYIKGSYEIWPRGAGSIKRGHCTVYFGKPMEFKDCFSQGHSREVYLEISQRIMGTIAQLERERNALSG
jgi:1-acyl-sn-glycerol-3-phosphate acyltransferase